MSIFQHRTESFGKHLTGSPQLLFKAGETVGVQLVSVWACNKSAGAAALTVELYSAKDATAYLIASEAPIAAHSSFAADLGGMTLSPLDEIRATASAPSAIDMLLTIKQAAPRSQG